jgi:hypothetical protein
MESSSLINKTVEEGSLGSKKNRNDELNTLNENCAGTNASYITASLHSSFAGSYCKVVQKQFRCELLTDTIQLHNVYLNVSFNS